MNGYDKWTMDALFYLFISLVSFLSSPLLDILLERIMLGPFDPLSEEGHCVTTPASSAFDIPKPWSSTIIPDIYFQKTIPSSPVVAGLHDLFGSVPPPTPL